MLAYVHIAKTGGRTVRSMLRSSFGPFHCDAIPWQIPPRKDPWDVQFVVPKLETEDFRRIKRVYPRLKSIAGHTVTLFADMRPVWGDVQYFAFLREPLARGASHYQYHITHETPHLEWDAWVKWEVHHNHQTKMLSRAVSVAEAVRLIADKRIFVGLMERYDESLVLLKALFAPQLKIAYEKENVARDNTVAHQLLKDTRSRDAIREYSQLDLELYDYVRQELYPSYLKEYGPALEEDVRRFRVQERGRLNRRHIWMNRVYNKCVYLPAVRAYRWRLRA